MKLEKLTDNQIRCYISADDLSARSIRISELVYGSEKAKNLFKEVLSEAERELNFDTSDIPLVIEAMPMQDGTIMMQITKVDDPEELDTRFARFAPLIEDGDEYGDGDADHEDALTGFADEILKAMQAFTAANAQVSPETQNSPEDKPADSAPGFCRVYRFSSLDEVSEAGRAVASFYDGDNSLYKDPENNTYLLVLHPDGSGADGFNKVCNQLAEYAPCVRNSPGTAAYCEEHYPKILAGHALQSMKNL